MMITNIRIPGFDDIYNRALLFVVAWIVIFCPVLSILNSVVCCHDVMILMITIVLDTDDFSVQVLQYAVAWKSESVSSVQGLVSDKPWNNVVCTLWWHDDHMMIIIWLSYQYIIMIVWWSSYDKRDLCTIVWVW